MVNKLTQETLSQRLNGDLTLANPLRIEAEDMSLTNYRLESSQHASGKSLISFVKGKRNETGLAAHKFTGASNRYDVVVAYFDENDGQANLEVTLNGSSLEQWTLDRNLGSNRASSGNLVRRTIATGLEVKQGDLIEILGTEVGAEHARVDYIEFIPAGQLQVEAEDYSAYYDKSVGNQGKAYRRDDVDIEKTKDVGGGYNVGWITKGEWLEYSVEVPEAGTYNLDLRVAAPGSKQKSLSVNGQTVKFSPTGGGQNWKTVSAEPLVLSEGTNNIRIKALSGQFNFNYFKLTPVQADHDPVTEKNNSIVKNESLTSEVSSNSQNQSLQLGTNLSAVNYWSSQLPFQDSFKSSRPWRTLNKQWRDIPLDLDENGWVKSLPSRQGSPVTVETVLHKESGGYRSGTYVVLYDGEGTLHYHTDAQKDEAASRPGREVIEVSPSEQGIFITLNDTDPNNTGNYLRNLRIVPLEQENSSERFTPEFLDKVEAFDTFRFMDWMNTNNSKQQHWDARPTLDSATWTKAGVPVEIMVELANRTDTNPWFNMPHQATDDYITQFAEYVQENLDPHLNVYVEYSNEVWNTNFKQNRWVEQQAGRAWSNSSEPKETKITDWHSRRTTQMTQIWDEVFGGDKERVIGVMGAQAANLTVGERALEYAWSSEDLSHSDLGIDAIAIAPYFGEYIGQPQHKSQVEQWTKEADGGLNKLFDELTQGGVLNGSAGGALQQASTWIENYAELAEQENLKLVAYEGGQSLVGKKGVENNRAITNLFVQANRDSRMGDVYRDYLERWSELDGGLFLNFSDVGHSNKWGSWGTLEHVFDDSSPKYDALMDFLTPANNSLSSI